MRGWWRKKGICEILRRINDLSERDISTVRVTRIIRGRGDEQRHIPDYDDEYKYDQYASALLSKTHFWPCIPDSRKQAIVRKALAECILQGDLSGGAYKDNIANAQAKYRRKIVKDYCIIGTLSVRETDTPFTIVSPPSESYPEASIEVLTCGLDDFKSSESWENRSPFSMDEDKLVPEGYSNFRVRVEARSVSEAVEAAGYHIERIMGYWTVLLHPRRLVKGKHLLPFTTYVYGPKIAVKEASGYYTVSDSLPPVPILYKREKSPEHYVQVFDRVDEELQDHPYREVLDNTIVRYANVLHSRNADTVLAGLWSVLEGLCDTVSHETVIRRASFAGRNREVDRAMLEEVAHHRHAHVHEFADRSDAPTLIDLARSFISRLIEIHVRLGNEFESVKELAEGLLDLPNSDQSIQESLQERETEIKLLNTAKEYLDGKDWLDATHETDASQLQQ